MSTLLENILKCKEILNIAILSGVSEEQIAVIKDDINFLKIKYNLARTRYNNKLILERAYCFIQKPWDLNKLTN